MRNPIEVLKTLQEKAGNENYQFERLYRNLYNEEFFLLAYGNLSAKEGNLTKGTDGATIDGMGMERIRKLIESLRNHSYQPSPARRAYIPKSNGKRRPLGIPSVDDNCSQFSLEYLSCFNVPILLMIFLYSLFPSRTFPLLNFSVYSSTYLSNSLR